MKKYIIILILALLLIFSGCAKKEEGKTATFYGGNEGISISFKKIAPPEQFNQGQEVPVAVLLKNSGEYDIVSGNAKAQIYGINHKTFNLPQEYRSIKGNLRGKGEFNIEGGESEISFGNLKYTEEIINSRDTEIRARLCYPYQTKTEIPVCIKSSISQETGEGVCSVEGEKVTKGTVSSAPIQVTSITEKTRGSNQVRFDIKIEDKGSGKVYSNDASCEQLGDDLINLQKKNKIFIEVINPIGVTCAFRSGEDSNKGIVELDDTKQKIISCWMEAEDTYTDYLKLTLSYMYTDTTSKKITIFEK